MAKRVRVGIIGCGQISKILHVPDYAHCPEAEIVAFSDVIPEAAEALAARWAPDARVYTDYDEMLETEKLDAVTVTLPNVLHCQATLAALNAGCHVLVEKPMATNSADAKKMVETAKKARKKLLVNHCQRLIPAHAKAREVVEKGVIGKVLHATSILGHDGPENWSPTGSWFFKKKEAHFGVLADLGVHKADILRFITGKEIDRISAYARCVAKENSEVDDNFVSAFTFTDGAVGTLSASWTVQGESAKHTILHGTKGTLRVFDYPGRPVVVQLADPDGEATFEVPPGKYLYEGSWGLDVSGAFVRCILGKEKPFCSGEEGRKSLEIILAASESARTGKSVKVNR